MGELGPSFSTGRLGFLLLFLTRAGIFFILLAIGFPLLLTFTPAPFLLLDLFLRPVGHRVHLGSYLEDNKQDKKSGDQTLAKQNERIKDTVGDS